MQMTRALSTDCIFALLIAALAGCATSGTPRPAACADLTGTYENQSSPPGQSLARFLLGADDPAPRVEVLSQSGSIVVSTRNRKTILAVERDFVCTAEGIRLTKTDARNIRLPPLIVENQTIHYVFDKKGDGSLRMIARGAMKGTTFGIPIATQKEEQRSETQWRAVPAL